MRNTELPQAIPGLFARTLKQRPSADRSEVSMLVTFHSKAYADITMFGDVAKELLHLMGHSGTVPSAIKAQDVPAALARLETAIAQRKKAEAAEPKETKAPESERDRDDEAPRKVPLSHRALPLLELLRASAARKVDVMWDS